MYTPIPYYKAFVWTLQEHSEVPHDSGKIVNRLRRIEGQVRGVAQMVEDDRYCIDILTQVQVVKAALGRAESEILKRHAACCVAEAIASGDEGEQQKKFSELIDLFEKAKR